MTTHAKLNPTELGNRLSSVRARIVTACESVDRDPAEVTLVAVAKGHSAAAVRWAYEAGCRDFGESYIQEAVDRIPWLPDDIRWHMVGHLQRNKAAEAVHLFDVLHAVDSVRLLMALEDKLPTDESDQPEAVGESGAPVASNRVAEDLATFLSSPGLPVLLQVNVSGEADKYGIAPNEAGKLVETAGRAAGIRPVGLMTLPPYSPDPEASRPVFKALRRLRDQLQNDTGIPLPHLSMGMSGDFAVAVEEGATLVRVGTAIFGPRD